MPPLEPSAIIIMNEHDETSTTELAKQLSKASVKVDASREATKIRVQQTSDVTETTAFSLDTTDSASTLSGADEEGIRHDPPLSEHQSQDPQEVKPPAVENTTNTAPSDTPRRPILKPISQDIPISQKATWLNLPKPDMNNIPRSVSAPEPRAPKVVSSPSTRRRSSVAFGTIQIREYDQTLGDNPSVSYGPPISLDWKFEEKEPITLDEYEGCRDPRRSLRQMCMNYYTRRNVLMWSFGYTEEQLNKATKDAERAKRGRALTKAFLPIAKVEDLFASAGRKAKRAVVGKKAKRSQSV